MAGMEWGKWHYLDASAMVKIVIDERDCQSLREFFNMHSSYCTTLMCHIEALSVLKGKWARKQISIDKYLEAARQLHSYSRNEPWKNKIEIDDSDILNPSTYTQVEFMARKHTLDLSDALQLVSILHGKFSVLGPNSASVLITADKNLAKAATAEGIRAWNCISGDPPSF